MHRALRHLALAVLLVAPAACASRAGTRATVRTVILFENQSLNPTAVYAIRSGGDIRRIGNVGSGRTEEIVLPADLAYNAGPVTFLAVPLASNRAASTGPVTVNPGDRLSVTFPISENTLSVLPVIEP
jgi:hypothetical protein